MTDQTSSVPSPDEMAGMQNTAFQAEVQRLVDSFITDLEGQRNDGECYGRVFLCNFTLTPAQKEAVQRFREAGWTVLVKADLSNFYFSWGRELIFKRRPHFNINVPMPGGVAAPRSDCDRG